MKIALTLSALILLVGHAIAGPGDKATRERTTSEAIHKMRAKHQPYNLAGFAKSDKEAEAMGDNVADLMARSLFLTDGKHAVLMPAGAIIHVPEDRGMAVLPATDLPLVSWQEFFRVNQSWIRQFALDFEQATGRKPFDPNTAKALGKSRSLVVCTYFSQPMAPVAAVKDTFAKALAAK